MLRLLSLSRKCPMVLSNPGKLCKRALSTDSLKEGDILHNYEITKITSVPQLFLSAIELKHKRTNSKHLHLARDDSNNVFNVSFRTSPMDDTGVAHILEHIVLTGSKKFPVRDPFFRMLDRSMATFMNAMTGSDYTLYPFATQNATDFKNLMSVYLDAVFFPHIKETSFLQEGWRLEHSDCSNEQTPIIFKGVVFNEMKGMMSDQEYLFGTNLQQKILPDHTYGVCSGGDPLSIPGLTWEALKRFHATHYHPSNAHFYTYGNLQLEEHLKQIDEEVMQKFTAINPDTDVPSQPRWSHPRSAVIQCPPDDMAPSQEKQTSLAVSYLLTDITDSYECFVLSFLCNLLSDGPTSPFYKSLIDSGLGSSYAPATGFHSHQKECVFPIGLQGLHENDHEKVKNIISDTIETVIQNGFSNERIEGLLHQVELHQKHQKSQFGLHLSFNILPMWQHGTQPSDLLDVDKHILRLRNDLKDPEFFQKYCKKYFKENKHKLTLTMTPDPDYASRMDKQEEHLLEERLANLDQNQLKKILKHGKELAVLQNQIEDVSCLPTLVVADIPRQQLETKRADLYHFGKNIDVAMHEQPTNGVTYLSLVRTVNNLSDELKPLLPLFCSVLTQMGTEDKDYRKFSELEELYTGGLQASATISPSPSKHNTFESKVILSSHCLDKNMEKMFELWTELIQKPYFGNKERFQKLVRQNAQELANSVSYSGHGYAMSSASAELSVIAKQLESWEGLTQIKIMQSIAKQENMDNILESMKEISKYVLSGVVSQQEKVRCGIHCTSDGRSQVEISASKFLSELYGTQSLTPVAASNDVAMLNHADVMFEPSLGRLTFHELPLMVNFASMCLPTPALYTHPDSASLDILARILTTKFLLKEVREKGGAYGAGAKYVSDGVFQFFSYRDPRSVETIQTFQDSISWACEGRFTPQDLDEAKLGAFQRVDAPVSPCSRGMSHFLRGISDEMRQTRREQLLDATRDGVINAAQMYLTQENKNSVILGPQNEEIQNSRNWQIARAAS